MKKIAFGNSLMLLGIAIMILCALNMFNPFFFLPSIVLVAVGFILSAAGFIRGKE